MGFLSDNDIKGMTATLDQVANARLLKIQDTPGMDASGDPTGDGAVLWEGSAPGYLDRVRLEDLITGSRLGGDFLSGGAELLADTDVFTILDASGAPLLERPGAEWTGTTVTIGDDRTDPATTWTFLVKGLHHEAYGTLDSATLILKNPVKLP